MKYFYNFYMKLSEYAKLKSVTYRTAWQWFKDGKIEGATQLSTGTVVVPDIVKEPKMNMLLYIQELVQVKIN